MEIRPFENLELTDISGEKWKDVVGWDGIYQVSNMGRIKSLRRWREHPSGGGWLNEKILKQSIAYSNPNNLKELSKSLHIDFRLKPIRQSGNVSVVVGNAFLGECKENECFSKKNKIWWDIRACNLEIKTISESTKIAYEKGNNLRNKKCLQKGHQSIFKYIRLNDNKTFLNADLVKEHDHASATNIIRGINKHIKRYGSYWKREKINGLAKV